MCCAVHRQSVSSLYVRDSQLSMPAAGRHLRHGYRAGRHARGRCAAQHRQGAMGALLLQARRVACLAAGVRRAAVSLGGGLECGFGMRCIWRLAAHCCAWALAVCTSMLPTDSLQVGMSQPQGSPPPATAGYTWKRQPEADFPASRPQPVAAPAAAAGLAGGPVSDVDAALAAAGGGAGAPAAS
jgi:hypothetical protein